MHKELLPRSARWRRSRTMTGKRRRPMKKVVRSKTNRSEWSTVVERVICVLFEREPAICNDVI